MFSQLKSFLDQYISISQEEWELIQVYWVKRKFSKKEFLLKQGEICRSIAFINKGCFRYYSIQDSGEAIYHFFFENSFVWDVESFLNQQPCDRNLQALETSEIILLPYIRLVGK
jgi:CRP/FNR family transcriptional regulator, anaerobic regulatory protein